MKFPELNGELFAYGNHYLVQPFERPKQVGSIFIPETAAERVQTQGIIRERGTGEGPWELNIGDRVIFGVHAGATILVAGEKWKILGFKDIVGVVRGPESVPIDGGLAAAVSTRPAGEKIDR